MCLSWPCPHTGVFIAVTTRKRCIYRSHDCKTVTQWLLLSWLASTSAECGSRNGSLNTRRFSETVCLSRSQPSKRCVHRGHNHTHGVFIAITTTKWCVYRDHDKRVRANGSCSRGSRPLPPSVGRRTGPCRGENATVQQKGPLQQCVDRGHDHETVCLSQSRPPNGVFIAVTTAKRCVYRDHDYKTVPQWLLLS